MNANWFSLSRWLGIVGKEFIQLKRDRLTFGMIVGIPVIQLILFGFAINSDPKHLPMSALIEDRSEFSRSILAGLKNSDYFAFIGEARDELDADRMLANGTAQFVSRSRPISRAAWCAANARRCSWRPTRPILQRPATRLLPSTSSRKPCWPTIWWARSLAAGCGAGAFEVRIHPRYNPEAVTQYNIVPGLMGVILTMTMVMMTGLAITRERERGTMENLLATPATALEVMTGKIGPMY